MSSLKYDEIARGFAGAMGTYPGNSTFGQSFFDQYRNADAGLGYLRSIEGSVSAADKPQYDMLVKGAKSAKGSAIAGSAIAGLTAGAQVLGNALQAGQIADTTQYSDQIDDLSRVGTYGYNNFDEIARDYASTNFNGPDFTLSDIRGMSTGEKLGNIGSSALTGAAAGMQIGGPWGAAIGAVIGGGASLAGVLAGNNKARIEEGFLRSKADMASAAAHENLSAANERVLNNNNRQGVVHAVARGGQIERGLKSFTDNKLTSKPRQASHYNGRITRSYCKGGVKFRVRVK